MSGLPGAGRRVVVVGLAESGAAATEALARLGAEVLVTESRPLNEVAGRAAALEALGVAVRTGGHRRSHLDGADLVIASPGVPEWADVLAWARELGVAVWSELELGARLVARPYAAVTGTNGKTTTTELLAAAMRASGLDAIACGNVGYPFSRAASEEHDALVVEASSFQLRFQESLHPRVSVLLNLAPDHLDWHRSFDAYRDAKRGIFGRQRGDDVHVGNRDDPLAAEVSRQARCRVAWFTLGEPRDGEIGYVGERLVSRLGRGDDFGAAPFTAPAHRANAAAAAAAGLAFGLEADAVIEALHGFELPPHRGRVVAELDGVRFVDDSKATNPHAALASLAGLEGVVLVAGGRSKGVDLSPLAEAAPRLAAVVAMGEAADELAEVFDGKVPVTAAASIEEAVRAAVELAPRAGIVLLAPACASQDMFVDYRERGERFAAAARAMERGGRVAHG